MSQLGFTFYPKDWWTSDSFFLLQPYERYVYLECIFIMYSQDGWMSNNKMIVERRLCTTIKDEVWKKITSLFIEENGRLTHVSVNSRMRKTLANRENGTKGGRPKKSESDENKKPKKPKVKTQNNPPLEIEIEEEKETEEEKEGEANSLPINFKKMTKDQFYEELKGYVEEFSKQTVSAFFNYWSEMDAKGKMKFQKNDTWETKKRLITWKNKESQWK